MKAIKRLANSAFKPNHCAESNRVFLWKAHDEPPFMCPVSGWKIVGYGNAPWQHGDCKLAVMFERVDPPTSEYGNVRGDECKEGTRIWQHARPEWIPGLPEYEGRVKKFNK